MLIFGFIHKEKHSYGSGYLFYFSHNTFNKVDAH